MFLRHCNFSFKPLFYKEHYQLNKNNVLSIIFNKINQILHCLSIHIKAMCKFHHWIEKYPMTDFKKRRLYQHILLFHTYFLLFFKYGFLYFPPQLPPVPANPTSNPGSYPLWLCPCVLYTGSLMTLLLFSPIIPSHLPSGYCESVLYFSVSGYMLLACLFCLIRFHLQVRSYGICPSLPGLFHLA